MLGGLEGSRVLELGAGAGLAGLFAACHCDPSSVTLTERPHGELLSLLQRNAEAQRSIGGGDLHVRVLDWRSAPGVDQDALELMLGVGNDEREGERDEDGLGQGVPNGEGAGAAAVPELELAAQFDIVLASECVYSWEAALTLPCAVRAALAPGGRAVFVHIVREAAVQETLLAGLQAEGLRVAVREGAPSCQAGGSGMPGDVGRSGRFLLILADRADAPARVWAADSNGPAPSAGLRWLRPGDDLAAAVGG